MTFDAAAAKALYAALVSHASGLGIFQRVNDHEPLNAPGNGLSCTIELGLWQAVTSSGLASVSGRQTFLVRVWSPLLQRPVEGIDPEVLAAVAALLNAYCGDFDLGGTVRNIELLSLQAQPGYIDVDGKKFRVMEISLPILINDMFDEVA